MSSVTIPESQPRQPRHHIILFCFILAVALALRLIRLGTFPYWHDEVHNLIASEDVYALVIHGNLISNHPPLPYLLVALWRALGLDASEWTMRLLPVAFGMAAVAAIFFIGRLMFNARAGLFASFLLAIAPLHVYHSQDLKEYIYLPFVAIVMVHWFYRAILSERMRDWIVYGVLAGIACYTEIFVGPLLVAINLWAIAFLIVNRKSWTGWITGNSIGALLFLPWFTIMLRKAVGTMVKAENWWVPPPSPTGVAYFLKAVAFGYTAPDVWFKVATVVFVVVLMFGAVAAMRMNKQGAALVICWAVVPVAMVYVISLFTESIFLIRAMLPYAMALYLLAGIALSRMRPPGLGVTACVLMACLSGVGLYHQYLRNYPALDFPHRPGTHPPRDYDRSAAFILSKWREGDIVVHCSAATWLPFCWYGFRNMPSYFAGVGGKFISDIEMGNPRNSDVPFMENYWPREPQQITENAKRVWFVYGEWERKYLPGNATDAYRWMDAHFNEVDQHAFLGLDVLLYVRPEDAPVVKRDRDDGVAADVLYANATDFYRKRRLDNSLVPIPDDARKGKLRVRWNSGDIPGNGHILADTPATRALSFTIENTSSDKVETTVHVVPSDILLDAASLYEHDPSDEIWHVYGQHNPSPPPPNYDFSIASAHFANAGSGTLTRPIDLPAGTLDVRMLCLGMPGDVARKRSYVLMTLNDETIFEVKRPASESPWAWDWIECGTVNGSADSAFGLTAFAEQPQVPAYMDIAAITFTRQRGNQPSKVTPWISVVDIAALDSRQFDMIVDTDLGRLDVWVWEHGENGKYYRIFRLDSK